MVLDDDTILVTLLERVLTLSGHDVQVFSDPTICPIYLDHGVQCSQNNSCADVIIADQLMPNITGIDFFKLQRKRGCKALDKNKVLITGFAMTPDLEIAVKELGCHYIRKPFRIGEILQWVDECAERIEDTEPS